MLALKVVDVGFDMKALDASKDADATAPNRVWLADITYVETDQGWLYLATVLDLYSRKIVGWAMCDNLRADLPLAALRMAISAQWPEVESFFHTLKTELVHHRQYATRAEATRHIFAHIEGFYNRTRRHSSIGYIGPIEMEPKAA